MSYEFKKFYSTNLLLIYLISAIFVLSFALLTSFPYIQTLALNRTLAQEGLSENLLPAFKFSKYYVELKEKSTIELFIKPNSKKIKVEIIGAEGIGLSIDSSELIQKGLKIIKPKRPRNNNESKRALFVESMKFRTKVFFDLRKIENKVQTINAIDFKVFKIGVEAILPGLYTIQATVDDKYSSKTRVVTKPLFRVDSISPSTVQCGSEPIISISGRNLDSLTQILIEGNDIEIKDTEALEDGIIKAKLLVPNTASDGFRDVTFISPILGAKETVTDALQVVCLTLKPDTFEPVQGPQGEVGPQGEKGEAGLAGMDGMGICDNPQDTLMIFANNQAAGSKATSFFDPVLCNLTLGIPIGFNGYDGGPGPRGLNSLIKVTNEPDGSNCEEGGIKVQTGLDSNQNNVLDSSEIATTNYVCNGGDD